MNLWKNWKEAVWNTFPDLEYQNTWAEWEGKGTNLTAKIYKNKHFIKSREVDIWSDKTHVYNTIIYPNTGANLPCFGMDLMGVHTEESHHSIRLPTPYREISF